jgi:hypothetical protein
MQTSLGSIPHDKVLSSIELLGKVRDELASL